MESAATMRPIFILLICYQSHLPSFTCMAFGPPLTCRSKLGELKASYGIQWLKYIGAQSWKVALLSRPIKSCPTPGSRSLKKHALFTQLDGSIDIL